MFKNYFKTAWRNLKRSKTYSAINIGGLATGLASCLLLLLYVAYQWGYDKQFKNIENIYTIENNQSGEGKIFTFMATPEPLAKTIQNEVPGAVRAVRTIDGNSEIIGYGNNSFKKNGLFADSAFFSMFSYQFIRGDYKNTLLNSDNVVITKDLAKTLFGKEDALNKIIRRNNQTNLIVSGIIDNPPVNASFQFDYVMPWALYAAENPGVKTAGWSSNMCATYVELKSSANFKSADALIRKMVNSHQNDYKAEVFLFPFSKQHLYSRFENGKSVGGAIEQRFKFSFFNTLRKNLYLSFKTFLKLDFDFGRYFTPLFSRSIRNFNNNSFHFFYNFKYNSNLQKFSP